ncbi:MAG: AAA family ATPase [Aurantimonas endophytica]|uniref:AAA family ATPase n=1 Tax=Aurantimonas endophytica TaxID=1522175 RepID=UPI003001388D
MAKKANPHPSIRVVGSRKIPDSLDEPHADFSEDAVILDDRAQAAAAAIANLSPSRFILYRAMRDMLPAEVVDRINRGRTVAVSIDTPSDEWAYAASRAFDALIYDIAAGDVRAIVECQRVRQERTISAMPARDLVHALARGHALLAAEPGQPTNPTCSPFIDASIAMAEIGSDYVVEALRRGYPQDADVRWPRKLRLVDLDPSFLDVACERAETASQAIGYVVALAAVEKPVKEVPAAAKSRNTDTRTIAETTVLRPTSPRLEDLSGYGAAAAWGRDLCDDLAAYRDGKLGWSEIDAGCLLAGPPGTGKTLFASALAASAGVAFVPTSYADWQSSGDGHAGHVTKTMKLRFETAISNAPAILFIDEIDAIQARGKGGHNSDWWPMIVTAVLESLDGTSRREGIVVIAATNHAAGLDPALVRSGRLDRRFEIGLPDEAGLAGIFRHHMPEVGDDMIAPVATALAGSTSGADVARITREARRLARRQSRAVSGADLMAIALPADDRPEALRRLVAVHEAGHAVALMLGGQVPISLSIVAVDGRAGGVVTDGLALGMGRVGDIDALAIPILAGRAAEEVILGQASGGAGGPEDSDLGRATALIANASAVFGLGDFLVHGSQASGLAVEARLRRLYAEAVLLVVRNRKAVEKLADLALERRVLGQSQLREFGRLQGLL